MTKSECRREVLRMLFRHLSIGGFIRHSSFVLRHFCWGAPAPSKVATSSCTRSSSDRKRGPTNVVSSFEHWGLHSSFVIRASSFLLGRAGAQQSCHFVLHAFEL